MKEQGAASIDYSELFDQIHTVAVVGYSDNPQRAGHYVPKYLAQRGYQIIAINPRFEGSVDGFACYPSLSDIPAGTPIDVVDVFRAPEFVAALVDEAALLRPIPRYFWMQPGAENPEAASKAIEAGMVPISNECMLARHRDLLRS